MVLWGGLQGPRAAPGAYQARLRVGDETRTATFEVRADPRAAATPEDFRAQLRFLLAARDKLTETHRAVKRIRDVREQLAGLGKRLKGLEGAGEIRDAAQALEKKLTAVEEALHQTRARSPQDVLNYPIRLNNKLSALAGVVGMGDNRPTEQAERVREELTAQIDVELKRLRGILDEDLARFNDLLARWKVPSVIATPERSRGS
jgi:hypothetical protein